VTRWLFLVGGSAGSGKSSLGKALARQLDAGWLQLDSIWLAMKVAAGEGTRARAILDNDRRMRQEDEADDDVRIAHVAASDEVCRALPAVLALELEAHERLVVDGAWLLPSFVAELELPDTDVRAVYVVQRTEADVEAALLTSTRATTRQGHRSIVIAHLPASEGYRPCAFRAFSSEGRRAYRSRSSARYASKLSISPAATESRRISARS
jgi:2-phosphoglycerate kinase